LKYYSEFTNHHSTNIHTVAFDGGGEFNSNESLGFLSEKGMQVQVTAPYTPQQNAVAKRGNQTTRKKARAMLRQANLPPTYWGEAVSTAVFLDNVTPASNLNWDTPHKRWFGRKFDISRLRPFGCLAYVNIPKQL
jgi:transposase InsO family protein